MSFPNPNPVLFVTNQKDVRHLKKVLAENFTNEFEVQVASNLYVSEIHRPIRKYKSRIKLK